MIITLSGDLGSGKSTVAKQLAKQLGWKRISVGDTWRELAVEKGMSIHEFNNYVIQNPHLDKAMDERLADKARKNQPCIVEGRAQWYFLPESLKLYFKIHIDEAARRVFEQKRASETENTSMEITKYHLQQRARKDKERFEDLYGVDYTKTSHYDFIIHTTYLNADQICEKILEYSKQH